MDLARLFATANATAQWEYDDDADALYLSFGEPKPATGVDIGQSIIVRFDEKAREVVGLTIIGVGMHLEDHVRKTS